METRDVNVPRNQIPELMNLYFFLILDPPLPFSPEADMIGSYSCLITTYCDALAAHPASSLTRTLVSIIDIIFIFYLGSEY